MRVRQFLAGLALLIFGVWLCSFDAARPVKASVHGISTLPSIPAVAAANSLDTLAFYDGFPGINLSNQWSLKNAWPNASSPFDGWSNVTTASPTPLSDIVVSNPTATLSHGFNGNLEFFMQTAQSSGASFLGQGF